MIVIDTSALVDALTGARHSLGRFQALIQSGERIVLTAVVFYEWRRGPRLREELVAQEELFPTDTVIAFDGGDAGVAAELYRSVRSPRGREIDLTIASMALTRDASLWTLNVADFADIPALRLIRTHPVS